MPPFVLLLRLLLLLLLPLLLTIGDAASRLPRHSHRRSHEYEYMYGKSSSARSADPLVQALYHSDAPPADIDRSWAYSPAVLLDMKRTVLTVDAFGADPTGKQDSAAAFQAAIAAAPPGAVISLPGPVYALSGTVVVNKSVAIDCRSTIRPFAPPTTQIPFINISAVGGASFDGHGGECVFDGVSSRFNNFTSAIVLWDASNVSVAGVHVVRLAKNQTSASNPLAAIVLSAVSDCEVRDCVIEQSGVTGSYHIGFGVYLVYSTDCLVTNTTVRLVGSTGINDSGGLRNRFVSNHLSHIALFPIKGGYGFFSVANTTQSTRFFTVKDSFATRAAFRPGKYVNILDAKRDIEGLVSHHEPQPGRVLRVVMQEPMAAPPSVGALAQPLSTSLRYLDNTIEQCGDNGHDINGWHDIWIVNATCRGAGMYQPTGVSFGGLATCIWLGYDPQNALATFRGIGARIIGTRADVVGKTGIMVTEGVSDVVVEGYELHHINARGPVPDSLGRRFHPCDTCCGIALNRKPAPTPLAACYPTNELTSHIVTCSSQCQST
jgi:hypothetical protein|eukprot:COSAG06_NODE_3079_length_5887_cov_2.216137_2_plen_548_part_00